MTNAVSAYPTSAAIASIASSLRPPAPSTMPAGLPPPGSAANAEYLSTSTSVTPVTSPSRRGLSVGDKFGRDRRRVRLAPTERQTMTADRQIPEAGDAREDGLDAATFPEIPELEADEDI